MKRIDESANSCASSSAIGTKGSLTWSSRTTRSSRKSPASTRPVRRIRIVKWRSDARGRSGPRLGGHPGQQFESPPTRARRRLLEAKKEASGLAAKEVENTLLEIPEIPLIELEPKRVVIDTKALNKRSGRLYRLRSRQSLMTHPPAKGKAKVAYLIGGGFARFEAVVAFSDSAKKPRSHLVFEVWGDNKRLWR